MRRIWNGSADPKSHQTRGSFRHKISQRKSWTSIGNSQLKIIILLYLYYIIIKIIHCFRLLKYWLTWWMNVCLRFLYKFFFCYVGEVLTKIYCDSKDVIQVSVSSIIFILSVSVNKFNEQGFSYYCLHEQLQKQWLSFAGDCTILRKYLASRSFGSSWASLKFMDALFRGYSQV